jgi:hypothetical protein
MGHAFRKLRLRPSSWKTLRFSLKQGSHKLLVHAAVNSIILRHSGGDRRYVLLAKKLFGSKYLKIRSEYWTTNR